MKKNISIKGKNGKNKRQRKKVTINDLNENDRLIYQEIMEEILEDHGINPNIIIDKIKKIKEQKDSQQISNVKKFCILTSINRTYVYNSLKVKKRKINSNMCLNFVS